MSAKYRITFTIEGRGPDDDDFTDVGFGSSGSWPTIKAALNDLDAIIEHGQWETGAGMPEPADLLRSEL